MLEGRELGRALAEQIPPHLRDDLSAYSRLNRMYHTGSDFYGNQISPEQRITCGRLLGKLRTDLALKHTNGDEMQLFGLMSRYRMQSSELQLELIRQSEEKTK